MQTDDTSLPLSARIDRLFATFHSSAEPEQSVDHVAHAVTDMLNRTIAAADIAALRAGEADAGPADVPLLEALARHFNAPPDYLTGDSAVAIPIHGQLGLLAAARDAGVRHFVLRGGDVDIDELAARFTRLAEINPHTPDQET